MYSAVQSSAVRSGNIVSHPPKTSDKSGHESTAKEVR